METLTSLLAQNLGARPNPIQTVPAGDGGVRDLIQLGVALLVVLAVLKWLVPSIVARFQGRLRTPLASSLRIEESATFGPGQLSVVTVRGRTLLIGSTPQAVSMLADLSEADRQERAGPDAFFEILDRAEGQPPAAEVAAVHDDEGMNMDDAMALIIRAKGRIGTADAAAARIDRLIDGDQ